MRRKSRSRFSWYSRTAELECCAYSFAIPLAPTGIKGPPLKLIEECIILHVEDDDASAYLFQHALVEANLNPRVFRVTNGEDASAFLMKKPPYADAPTPDMVLLDLNLPRKVGLDVLREARTRPHLRGVRFVVLTTSDYVSDREEALAAGADAYLIKASEFDAYLETAKSACGVLKMSTSGGNADG